MFGKSIGWIGTAAWAIMGWLYVFHLVGLQNFLAYEPDQVGQSFIGFFAPLAFFWVIIGYFQQGATLARHAKILERQITELCCTLTFAEQRTPADGAMPAAPAMQAPSPPPAPVPAAAAGDAPASLMSTPYNMFYWAADLTIRELTALASDIVRVSPAPRNSSNAHCATSGRGTRTSTSTS